MVFSSVQQTSGGTNVCADFLFTVSVTLKFDDASAVKLWTVEAGLYGLPSKAGAKMAPSTSLSDVYAALQQFLEEECARAGAGMAGQTNQQMVGMNVAQFGMSITWTPVVNKLTFEGDEVPNSFEAVSSFLKDGEMFQATGFTRQEVKVQEKKHPCCVIA
eukprot:TRINITY_DN10366_c0_g2_i1.p1 TRINITY_DN10366_c0_g2~~TRINITY_DN10366_c0_g2_i1.p1  ORF type:complete len:160 (+),score=37.02 TRINITY_DN10366_c0_g2_i1:92-571(+)